MGHWVFRLEILGTFFRFPYFLGTEMTVPKHLQSLFTTTTEIPGNGVSEWITEDQIDMNVTKYISSAT